MAGHSKFKNIQHRKSAQDAKRSKNFGKLIREIMVAIKTGTSDVDFNPRLRTAIASAKAANLPKDKIENAIKKASSSQDDTNFEEVRYEAYAPGGVALIIEALTDNRNRTASDVKSTISKQGGNIAEPGSVIYMFDKMGFMEYHDSKIPEAEMLDAAIEAGADDCVSVDDNHEIYCDPSSFHEVNDSLSKKVGEASSARLYWKAKNMVVITNLEQAEKLLKLIEAVEDNDDVQSVSGNYQIDDSIADKIKV
ncbi:MAG: YebC/PmpR family DNA-binding transcriptional regulator [Alphaproteobacteria bacterium]|nr:YebC/PmpR family DNA-binding transcriptional regulator [Alphaproteobacteria bacterium]